MAHVTGHDEHACHGDPGGHHVVTSVMVKASMDVMGITMTTGSHHGHDDHVRYDCPGGYVHCTCHAVMMELMLMVTALAVIATKIAIKMSAVDVAMAVATSTHHPVTQITHTPPVIMEQS